MVSWESETKGEEEVNQRLEAEYEGREQTDTAMG